MAHSGDMADRGEPSRPSFWRVVGVSVTVVAGVLWAWSKFTWWIIIPLVGGLLIAHLLIPIFPKHWRDGASRFARVLIVVLVAIFLLRFTPAVAWGVAIGAGCLVCVFQLRTVLPPWAQWTAVGLSVALAVTCGLVAWLSLRADEARREAAERADHEYRVAEMRPDQPLGMFHLVVKAIHENDPMLACFVFTPDGEREFAEAAHAEDCPAAIAALHEQITGKGYGNATVAPDEITHETGSRPATVAGCRMYIVDGPLEYRQPPGPMLGTFRLAHDPRFPTSGYLITGYTPCGQIDPNVPTTSVTTPPVLPSYPPGLPGMLAQAITTNDDDVCDYFTEQGARQFAATVAADSCPEAIEVLNVKVSDTTAYINPDGETVTTQSGTTEVDACTLTWNRYGTGAVTAGPQLGHFTLVRPAAGSPGYLIGSVRPC
jgi:hypothetical protein